MMWDQWAGYGMGWGFFGLVHALWWVLVVLAIVGLVRWGIFGGRIRDRHALEDRAVAILRERYARGEIDKPEFDEKMKHLRG